ncbi:MAG: heavy metal-responsive transcriptional regulator [Acidimicrobiia bacterium]|nr:heavy metal-responsive transcriptional regulator [Acidimicrobiia bacterium]
MKIGELAARTGVSTKTIRYYEEIGLVPEPDRTPNGYRDYREAAVGRLQFVKDAQATGLSLAEIASIVELRSDGQGTCDHVADLLERHLASLDKHIRELRQARAQLADLAKRARSVDPEDCTDPVRCQTIISRSDHSSVTEPVHHHS